MEIEIESYQGQDILTHVNELAGLRIEVFREFPYLYEGSIDYEIDYLQKYADANASIVGIARAGRKVVGATTGLPLRDADKEFQQPFLEQGHSVDEIYYFGESVVLPDYRGFGTGAKFFGLREKAALEWGARSTCFCAVERPANYPLRPQSYRSNHSFWNRLGYQEHPELSCRFPWKQVDSSGDVINTLTFWIKEWK